MKYRFFDFNPAPWVLVDDRMSFTEQFANWNFRSPLRSLDTVSEETLELFKTSAEKLIEERGAVPALAAALALISGSTEITSRSLITSEEVSLSGFP